MANSLDNQIRRLNKRLETVAATLGVGSSLYGTMKRILHLGLIKSGSKNKLNRSHGKIAINRGKNTGITKQMLDWIEGEFNKHSLTAEKQKLRKFAKDIGLGKVKSYSQYKKIAEFVHDLSNRVDEIFDWIYKHRNDPVVISKADDFKRKIAKRDNLTTYNAVVDFEKFISNYQGHANASPFDT